MDNKIEEIDLRLKEIKNSAEILYQSKKELEEQLDVLHKTSKLAKEKLVEFRVLNKKIETDVNETMRLVNSELDLGNLDSNMLKNIENKLKTILAQVKLVNAGMDEIICNH